MTRQYFYDNYNTWGDLISFCGNNNLSACDNIYTMEDVRNKIEDIIRRYTPYESITYIKEAIEDVDFENYNYFDFDGYKFSELSDDDDVFNDVLEDAAEEYDDIFGFDDYEEDDEEFFDDYLSPTQHNADDSPEISSEEFEELMMGACT